MDQNSWKEKERQTYSVCRENFILLSHTENYMQTFTFVPYREQHMHATTSSAKIAKGDRVLLVLTPNRTSSCWRFILCFWWKHIYYKGKMVRPCGVALFTFPEWGHEQVRFIFYVTCKDIFLKIKMLSHGYFPP